MILRLLKVEITIKKSTAYKKTKTLMYAEAGTTGNNTANIQHFYCFVPILIIFLDNFIFHYAIL